MLPFGPRPAPSPRVGGYTPQMSCSTTPCPLGLPASRRLWRQQGRANRCLHRSPLHAMGRPARTASARRVRAQGSSHTSRSARRQSILTSRGRRNLLRKRLYRSRPRRTGEESAPWRRSRPRYRLLLPMLWCAADHDLHNATHCVPRCALLCPFCRNTPNNPPAHLPAGLSLGAGCRRPSMGRWCPRATAATWRARSQRSRRSRHVAGQAQRGMELQLCSQHATRLARRLGGAVRHALRCPIRCAASCH